MDVCAGVQLLLSSDSVKVHEDVLSQVVLLKRLFTARMTDEQTRQICQVLNSLSDHCQAPHDPLQAHTVNQNIITSHCQYRLDSLSSSSRLVAVVVVLVVVVVAVCVVVAVVVVA